MSLRDPIPSLRDLLEYGRRIIEFGSGKTFQELRADQMRYSAILYHFAVLGEATNRLGKDFHAKYPEVPWSDIVRFRNVIVHGYSRVDFSELLNVIDYQLPPVLRQIEEILESLSREGN